jgi:hypothetical protein
MNIYEHINDFYSGIDEEDIFEYTDNIVKVYCDENDDEYEEESLIKYVYENNNYYFTPSFLKVKFSTEKNKYYAVSTDLPYKVEFKFPQKNIHLIMLQPKLALEYDEIHDLIIKEALNIAIKYIQCNFINYTYDEVESINKKMKQVSNSAEQLKRLCISLQQENIILKKRLDKLERQSSQSKVDSYIDTNQQVI